jgi:hypothetical protein
MKKNIYFLLLLLLFSCGNENPYPNKISDFNPELQVHLKKLASKKELSSGDTISKNYIKEKCSKEELLKLLKCENPLLRVIAYRAIVNRNEKDYFKILLGHLNDTTKVTWWYFEDAADSYNVSDLLIRKAVDNRKLTKTEKQILADSVLFKHSYLETTYWVMTDIEPNEKYYSIIKQKSKIKTNRCGLQSRSYYALSKFKKTEDLEFLKSVFSKLESPCEDWAFRAIEENPNKIYFPILEKYLKTIKKNKMVVDIEEMIYYCRSVAKYKSKESLMLLTEILNKSNYIDDRYLSLNQKYVFKAIHKHKTPIYADLYKKLKPQMGEYVIKYIDSIDYRDKKTW